MFATLPLVAAPLDDEGRLARARADGYLYVPGLVPVERIAAVRAVVDAALARRGWLVEGASDPALRLGAWDDARWVELQAEVLPAAAYQELGAAPEIVSVIRGLVGGEPELRVGDICRVVSPDAVELATPPHQDAAYVKDPDSVWTAWLALGPCPRELGPLALLSGSHTGGLRPHAAIATGDGAVGTEIAADAVWHAGDLAAGDVIFFSALTVHRALPNVTTDQLRVSVDYRYRRSRRDLPSG
jgi:ectoine hydroxylase-related dioxygenase (phytanoyl-CoA dioxygenase family)